MLGNGVCSGSIKGSSVEVKFVSRQEREVMLTFSQLKNLWSALSTWDEMTDREPSSNPDKPGDVCQNVTVRAFLF